MIRDKVKDLIPIIEMGVRDAGPLTAVEIKESLLAQGHDGWDISMAMSILLDRGSIVLDRELKLASA